MSYILDALRKADAQRERSRAPGLNDQPVTPAEAEAPRPWTRPALLGGVAAIGVLSIAWVAWQMAASPAPAVVAAQPPAVPAPIAEAPPPAPAQAPAVATAVVPPPPEPKPAPPARVAPPVPAPAPAVAAAPRAVPAAAPGSAAAASAAAAPGAAAAAASAEPGPAPAGAPRLAISGGVYSQNPAQRMLIVGGQVYNEGSEVAPGVRLEQVRPHQAVLSWRGQRYAVGF